MAEGYVEGTVCFLYKSVSQQLLDQTQQYLAWVFVWTVEGTRCSKLILLLCTAPYFDDFIFLN
jgi:hypothetical protein